ncbi:Fc.00g108330.m01.CDS01 [Cosmosporella sp. VM-42]
MSHSSGRSRGEKMVFGRPSEAQEAMVIFDGEDKKCTVAKCNLGVGRWKKNGVEMWSPRYCKNHACKVGPDRCNNKKSSKARYCVEHATCKALGCTAEPTLLSERSLPWYCPTHICSYVDTYGHHCTKGLRDGFNYCEGHLRKTQRKALVEITCAIQECCYQRDTHSWYCTQHKCLECNELGDHDRLCSNHQPQPCRAPACYQARVRLNNNELDDFCAEHSRCQESGCDSIVFRGTHFCEFHCCKILGCNWQRDQSLESQNCYCQIHSCIEDGCTQPRASETDPRYRRCVCHTCGVDGCHTKALTEQGYCNDHTCKMVSCYNGINSGHIYCGNHECKDSDCHAPAKLPSGYCAELKHACNRKGCAARNGDVDYPTLCPTHARSKVRQAGIEEGRRSAVESEVERRTADVYSWADSMSDEAGRWRAERFMEKDTHRVPRTFADVNFWEKEIANQEKYERRRSPHDWERQTRHGENDIRHSARLYQGGIRHVPARRVQI